MHLLNTFTKTLEHFQGEIPPYAILSHRWDKQEVSFQDMSRPDVTALLGYAKLSAACDFSRSQSLRYLWMDTCCIDKSSSAELSEAINSMYLWYTAAFLCIVYLSDVEKGPDCTKQLEKSQWFRRGWTLQELIAPLNVRFVDKAWKYIARKANMVDILSHITTIDRNVLLTGDMRSVSVATKMSWASVRETTRPEDRAYSLMGIFGVNMPTIYGEGDHAFIRLQEEIMKKTDDQSIFAWNLIRNGYVHIFALFCTQAHSH